VNLGLRNESWSDGRLVRPAWAKPGRVITAPRTRASGAPCFVICFVTDLVSGLISWSDWPRARFEVRDWESRRAPEPTSPFRLRRSEAPQLPPGCWGSSVSGLVDLFQSPTARLLPLNAIVRGAHNSFQRKLSSCASPPGQSYRTQILHKPSEVEPVRAVDPIHDRAHRQRQHPTGMMAHRLQH
jgi:hypothetical protein